MTRGSLPEPLNTSAMNSPCDFRPGRLPCLMLGDGAVNLGFLDLLGGCAVPQRLQRVVLIHRELLGLQQLTDGSAADGGAVQSHQNPQLCSSRISAAYAAIVPGPATMLSGQKARCSAATARVPGRDRRRSNRKMKRVEAQPDDPDTKPVLPAAQYCRKLGHLVGVVQRALPASHATMSALRAAATSTIRDPSLPWLRTYSSAKASGSCPFPPAEARPGQLRLNGSSSGNSSRTWPGRTLPKGSPALQGHQCQAPG
jgi:hypothetical protein